MTELEADVLLDSDVVIDILHGDHRAGAWLESIRDSRLGFSIVVWMEVVAGACDKDDLRHLKEFLQPYRVFHITEEDSRWAAQQLESFRLSHHIGLADCLIAAIAARTGLPFYSRNLKHYAPLPDVQVIRPY